jgi:hypothetical protein
MRKLSILASLLGAGALFAAYPAVSDWASVEGEGLEPELFYPESVSYMGTSQELFTEEYAGLTGWAAVPGEGLEIELFHSEVVPSKPYIATGMEIDETRGWIAVEGEGMERELFYR